MNDNKLNENNNVFKGSLEMHPSALNRTMK